MARGLMRMSVACLLYTSSDAEDLPGKVATDTRYEKLSTDRSDCRLSFALSLIHILLEVTLFTANALA